MNGLWLNDLESLEAISQDEDVRGLFLRIAQLSQQGSLKPFLRELAADGDLDPQTKSAVAEIVRDTSFLFAVEDYVHRTRARH